MVKFVVTVPGLHSLRFVQRITFWISAFLLSFLIVGWTPAASAWSYAGHGFITREAVKHLPSPLRDFFEDRKSLVASYSGNEPSGQHYIDIDNYPEWPTNDFPRDLQYLISVHGSQFVSSNGQGPWTADGYVTTLSNRMANAHTVSAWDALLVTAGNLAHYVEDLHNPLHMTANYDGQMTGNYGIHSRYESTMIATHLGEDLAVEPNPAGCIDFSQNPYGLVDPILDEIEVNYWRVADILAADTAYRGSPHVYGSTYYTNMWNATGTFTHELFQQASELVASAWYTAWGKAGRPAPPPGPRPVFQQWQLQYFGCTNCPQAAATEDPDGDGLNNQQEYLVYTNPTNNASAFCILSVDRRTNDLAVTWKTVGGQTNIVQALDTSGSFATNFIDLSPNIIIPGWGDITTNYFDIGGATNKPARFYRIRLAP